MVHLLKIAVLGGGKQESEGQESDKAGGLLDLCDYVRIRKKSHINLEHKISSLALCHANPPDIMPFAKYLIC